MPFSAAVSTDKLPLAVSYKLLVLEGYSEIGVSLGIGGMNLSICGKTVYEISTTKILIKMYLFR
jgi:hypothetical protein